jgi:hypothetical protein
MNKYALLSLLMINSCVQVTEMNGDFCQEYRDSFSSNSGDYAGGVICELEDEVYTALKGHVQIISGEISVCRLNGIGQSFLIEKDGKYFFFSHRLLSNQSTIESVEYFGEEIILNLTKIKGSSYSVLLDLKNKKILYFTRDIE